MFSLLAASALADPANPSSPGNPEFGNTALNAFRHGFDYKGRLVDDAMFPQGLANLPALPAPPVPAKPVYVTKDVVISLPPAAVPPGPLFFQHQDKDWYDNALAVLRKRLAADPGNALIQDLIRRVQGERDRLPVATGDFDTAHERQIRNAPGLPKSVGEIGLRPGNN